MSDLYLKDEFSIWLKEQKKANGEYYSPVTTNNYINYLTREISKLKNISLLNTDLFHYTKLSEFQNAYSIIYSHPQFEEINAIAHNTLSSAMKLYKEFLTQQENNNYLLLKLFEQFSNYKNNSEKYDEQYKWGLRKKI